MRRALLVAALVALLPGLVLPGGSAGASSGPLYDRVYLLAADTDYLYWSVDRFDPELGVGSISRTCGGVEPWGIPGRSKPCLSGVSLDGTRLYSVFFFPASLFGEKVNWSSAAPLKFHIEGNINTAGAPRTVHLVVQKTGPQIESTPATEVSSGVWEGKITTGGPLNTTDIPIFYVRVRSSAPAATIELRLGGRSYIELPRAHAARSVPDLVREDTYSPELTTFASPTRSFTFNDANWAVKSFSGQTGPKRTFDLEVERDAEVMLAWVELYETPFLQDVRRGRPPDSRKIQQGASLSLLRDGELIDHSGYGEGVGGYGTEAVAALDVKAGPLTLEVDSADEEDEMPFTAYVLEVGGERTIRTMRWRFTELDNWRVPVAALCPASLQPLPTTDEVRSVAVDLDWDTEAVGAPAWTLRFDIPGSGSLPCSEGGTGDRVRLTMPAERIWYLGATPAYDATHLSAYDTTFELQAEYVYSQPPAA